MKNRKKLALLCILLIVIFALILRLEKVLNAPGSRPAFPDNNIVSISPSPETDDILPSTGSEQPPLDHPDGVQGLDSSNESPSNMAETAVNEPSESALPPDEVECNSPKPEKNQEDNILPDGFIYIRDALPDAILEIRYATSHNFTGRVVVGYLSDNASLTLDAAKSLKKANEALEKVGYGIKIYDAYRPKQAVDCFIKWSDEPEDNKTKAEFYPDYDKKDLFSLGYIARRSRHSCGSTIDLTIYYLDTGENLDMGSPYDFLGPISNHGTDLISEEQTKNRNILKKAMKDAGFKELRTEWWHYELVNEPYLDTYFDFPVK